MKQNIQEAGLCLIVNAGRLTENKEGRFHVS